MRIGSIMVLLALATAQTIVADTVISFASLSQSGSGMAGVGGSVSMGGFTFASGFNQFDVWEASSPNLPNLSPANTSLFEFFAGSTTTLSDGGTPFTLASIDLAPVLTGGTGSFMVSFKGTHPDLSTVSQTFTVADGTPPQLQTFAFSGFTNLVNVTFTQGTNIGFFTTQDTAYQFDNVVVSTAAPEPNLLFLLGAGLVWLVVRFTRRAITNS